MFRPDFSIIYFLRIIIFKECVDRKWESWNGMMDEKCRDRIYLRLSVLIYAEPETNSRFGPGGKDLLIGERASEGP